MGILASLDNISKLTSHMTSTWNHGDDAIVNLMLPVYYNSKKITQKDVDLAKATWSHVNTDSSPVYLDKIKSSTFAKTFPSCMDWVLFVYFDRLFDIHPLCKNMFKSEATKGSFFVGLTSFMFLVCENPKAFKARTQQIAVGHCEKGIKAVEYGIIGDVLFFTLNYCLGETVYTSEAHDAFVLVMSSMLSIIVPLAVSFEISKREVKRQRIFDQGVFYEGEMNEANCPFQRKKTEKEEKDKEEDNLRSAEKT